MNIFYDYPAIQRFAEHHVYYQSSIFNVFKSRYQPPYYITGIKMNENKTLIISKNKPNKIINEIVKGIVLRQIFLNSIENLLKEEY